MSTDKALIEKREELKHRLAAGDYKTLVDVVWEWFDSLIQKTTRQALPSPTWLITVILSLVIVLVGFISVYIGGDLITVRNILEQFGVLSSLFVLITFSVQAIVTSVVINQYIHNMITLWHEEVLDSTESLSSLKEFENWLEITCNKRLSLLFTIGGGLISGLYLVTLANSSLGVFVGYGSAFTTVILSMFSSIFLYLLFAFLLLSVRLSKYDLKLFAADPSSSQLINHLSTKLNSVVYLFGIYAGLLTLLSAWLGLFSSAGIFLVLLLWLPIITLFTSSQTSLSNIIRRAKWKTLTEIQAKVESLQASQKFENRETMDAIRRLMDYHDRVKATSNSALDFRTYLSFFNSLLLPLLGFLLGNIDFVMKLFTRIP